jgi:beta-galactosidase
LWVATSCGDATSHVPFQSKERKAFNGLALVIVRTKPGEAGEIRVKASSPGLPPAEAVLQSVRQ